MNIPKYVEQGHKNFWPVFVNWCSHNGIGKDEGDREAWWNCFIAGATAMYLEVRAGNVEVV